MSRPEAEETDAGRKSEKVRRREKNVLTSSPIESQSIAPGRPSPHSEPPGRAIADLRGRGNVSFRPLVDRHRRESPPRRGRVGAVSSKSPTLGSTGVDSAPSTRRALEGGPAGSLAEIPGWLVLVERGARRAPWGQSERAGDLGCVLRRRPNRRLRYSGVPRVVALFTGGNDLVLRQQESQSPSRRPRRRQGRCRGRQSQVMQDLPHDLGIREERQHDHRNGSGGCRAARTRESFYLQHAAEKLFPREPSSSRA